MIFNQNLPKLDWPELEPLELMGASATEVVAVAAPPLQPLLLLSLLS